MPLFDCAEVWLECEGKRMQEYDVTSETKPDREAGHKIVKYCYVELIPDARFKVKMWYDSTGKAIQGCATKVFVDGERSDGSMAFSTYYRPRMNIPSDGYEVSRTSQRPYLFRLLELSEDADETKKAGMGEIEVSAQPFIQGRPFYGRGSSTKAAPVATRSHPDSKAAMLGYSVGFGAEVRIADRGEAPYYPDPAPGLPKFVAIFRYRSRAQLIAQGLIKDDSEATAAGTAASAATTNTTRGGAASKKPTSSTTQPANAQASGSNSAQVKAESSNDPSSARKRLRDLQAEINSLRANLAGELDGGEVEEVKPKRFRIDATGEGPVKAPVKIAVDLTGDDDDDE